MVDKQKIEQAVRVLLEGIGEDTEREGLKETPARIARMYEELMAGMDEDAAVHLSQDIFYLSQYRHRAGKGYHLLFHV